MKVFVRSMWGEPLMPTTNRKARILLKSKKAIIYSYDPFCIQLCYPTGKTVQPCKVGIDTGSKNIGFAVTSNDKVLVKGEVELRQDVSSNLTTRKTYRNSRRNRKTRHRKPRFLNRTSSKKQGWLPPSVQSKIDITFRFIDKLCSYLPNCELHIEVGKFDVAKMINPEIQGVDYQKGQTHGFYDVRYFVFARDNYTCQVCKKKNKVLQTHHIIYRDYGGTDRADNLITVCTDCHTSENHKPGGILYEWMMKQKKVKLYKEPPFMNTLRKRIFKKYPNAIITYGSITTPHRKQLGLDKTHYNDAIAITGITSIKENCDDILKIKQFRKKKRSLHEATARKGRKTPNVTQKRNSKNTPYSKGYYLNDKVSVLGKTGYICGFTNSGAYVKDIFDEYITLPNKTYKQVSYKYLKFINHNNNWQMEYIN